MPSLPFSFFSEHLEQIPYWYVVIKVKAKPGIALKISVAQDKADRVLYLRLASYCIDYTLQAGCGLLVPYDSTLELKLTWTLSDLSK